MDKLRKLTLLKIYIIIEENKEMIIMSVEMKEIPGYTGYFATPDGRIYSNKSHKFLS